MEQATPESITQATTIAEADTILRMRAVIVREGDSLRVAAEAAVANTGCRVISVADGSGRLVGIIPVARLVDDVFLKVVPETSLGEILDVEAALEYAGHIGARVAGDIMSSPVSVRLDQTVRDAFAELKAHDLPGLPIVDDADQVVGYLDQLEMLLVWVRATGRQSLLEPRADPGS